MKHLGIFLFLFLSSSCFSQDFTGEWNGVLDLNGMELRIVFHVEQSDDGYTSTMDSPDQGASGIPTTSTSVEGKTITIVADNLKMNYSGQINDDGLTIEGTFKQGPMEFPLSLGREKVEKPVAEIRPQDPNEYPYTQEEVVFVNPIGGHRLAGTLTLPESGAFELAVILISGSGPQNRDEELQGMNHRPFLVLSDYLTRNGIAVLRYDDRGVGASGGDHSTATSKDFATDAQAALDFLRKRPEMEGKKIGVAGHSEGGMIAPMMVEGESSPDFMALLAGPGIDIKLLMILQSSKISKASGVPDEMIAFNANVLSEAYDYIIKNNHMDQDALRPGLSKIFQEQISKLPEEDLQALGDQETFINQQIDAITGKWFLFFIRYQPSKYLEKVECPILAINGALDLQVTANENLEGIRNSIKENPKSLVKKIEGQNHLFQTAKTGAPSEYGVIEETFNEETMALIANWIKGL